MLLQPDPHSPNRLQRFACFLLFLQANKSRIPVTWDYSGVQYLFKLVPSSNLNWNIAVAFAEHGQSEVERRLLSARQKHNHELRFKLVSRKLCDEQCHFECVPFRHDSV